MVLANKVLEALPSVADSKTASEEWVRPLGEAKLSGRNHCVLFVKPECLAIGEGVDVKAILKLVLSSLKQHDVKTGAVRIMNGPYLGRYRIMEQHYGVINRASCLGEEALSAPTREKLEQDCPDFDRILGAHQLIEQFPEITPFALNVMTDTMGTKKLAGGKYYFVLKIAGQRTVVLNPFHPQQIAHYTQAGKSIVIFECQTDTDWEVLRRDMTGATDPTRAVEGSIRRTLLENKDKLGLHDVSTASNGVHFSAGPLEGMVEFCRFFSEHAKKQHISPIETPFGHMLAEHGVSEKDIVALADNPILGDGGDGTYAFNLTEEKNAEAAAELLAKLVKKKAA